MKVKAKGNRLEREWASLLRESGLDKTARRMPMSGAMEDLKADIITELPFNFECKNQETWKPEAYMKQAIEGAKDHEIPVVVMKKNGSKPLIMMQASDWVWLCQLAKESSQLVSQYGFSKKKQTV